MSEAPQVAIIAALPRETRLLVRGYTPDPTLLQRGIHLYRLPAAVVVTAGMGASRAALAFQAAMDTGPLRLVISAGLAGSCAAALRPGSVHEADVVLDSLTGERFRSLATKLAEVVHGEG